MSEVVVLVHGIWMTGFELYPLGRRLHRCGYECRYFHYPSLRHSPEANARKLHAYLQTIDASVVHLVAHSLGGIVLAHLFAQFKVQRIGRVVMLGTPLQGSIVARHLYTRQLLRWLLGRSTDRGLLGDAPSWQSRYPSGMIAGTRTTGIGQFLAPGKLSRPHDGTVMVSETCSSELHQHCTVYHSHLSMLLSRRVAKLVCQFLQQGRFE